MNLASRAYQEKRSFIRMKVETPIDVIVEGRPDLKGICHNLSGGGMLISVPEILPLGTEVEVSVTSNHGHNPVLRARAVVSRVQAQPEAQSRPCHIGVEILSMIE